MLSHYISTSMTRLSYYKLLKFEARRDDLLMVSDLIVASNLTSKIMHQNSTLFRD